MINFQNLELWKKAHQLTLAIYKVSNQFPKHEFFQLTSQLGRSAISIPSNIAEGCGKNSKAELRRFFHIALGSSSELQYQLLLAKDLQYLSESEYSILQSSLVQIQKMLLSYSKKLI